jgi:ADP-ribose pyrophosphatase YjhB (NUDIX family)
MPWRRHIEPLLRPVARAVWRLRRGMTLGVRGFVQAENGAVLLVEHTYVQGWHLPGGGVERGETAQRALERELAEEAGVKVVGPVRLVAIHASEHFPGDHVLLYRIGAWTPCPSKAAGEILRVGWFDPLALPDGATAFTRRLAAEALAAGQA